MAGDEEVEAVDFDVKNPDESWDGTNPSSRPVGGAEGEDHKAGIEAARAEFFNFHDRISEDPVDAGTVERAVVAYLARVPSPVGGAEGEDRVVRWALDDLRAGDVESARLRLTGLVGGIPPAPIAPSPVGGTEPDTAKLQAAVDKAYSAMNSSQYVGGLSQREAWRTAFGALSEVVTQHKGQAPGFSADAGNPDNKTSDAVRGDLHGTPDEWPGRQPTDPDRGQLRDAATPASGRGRQSVDAGNPESEDYEAATTYQDALSAACGTEADGTARSSQGEDHDPGVMYERQMRHIELLRQQRDEARAELERLRGTEPDTAKLNHLRSALERVESHGSGVAVTIARDALTGFSVDAGKAEE